MQYKWIALTVTIVGTMMAGIDDRILVVGLPTIAKQIGANVSEAIWAGQAYTLASTMALLLVGRVADVRGRVKIYNAGFVIFTAGSALASISFSPLALIASRLVQGVGAATLSANSLAIVTDATPQNQLGTFIGLNQIAFRSGALIGLTLSGVILSFTDWRALFYVNIPIGIFGTIWARLRLREVSTKDTAKKMDWQGFLTFTGGLTLVLIAITYFSYGVSGLGQSVALLASGTAILVAFVIIEKRVEAPLLDLKLFKIKAFAVGSSILMSTTLAWNGMLYMTSFFLQIVLGLSALQAGVSYLPLELCYLGVGLTSARMSDRYGSRVLVAAGQGIMSVACLYASTFAVSTGAFAVIGFLVLLAAGQGMFTSPNRRAIMRSVPSNRRGVASGFSGTLGQIGNTAGPVVAITLITIGIPYNMFTSLLQGAGSVATELARMEFVSGFKIAALVLGVINSIAIIPSLLREKVSAAQVATERDDEEPTNTSEQK